MPRHPGSPRHSSRRILAAVALSLVAFLTPGGCRDSRTSGRSAPRSLESVWPSEYELEGDPQSWTGGKFTVVTGLMHKKPPSHGEGARSFTCVLAGGRPVFFDQAHPLYRGDPPIVDADGDGDPELILEGSLSGWVRVVEFTPEPNVRLSVACPEASRNFVDGAPLAITFERELGDPEALQLQWNPATAKFVSISPNVPAWYTIHGPWYAPAVASSSSSTPS